MIASSITALAPHGDVTGIVATVYTAALLATFPIAIAAIANALLRRSSAEARSLVWRSAVVGLLAVFIGRQVSLHWMAVVVPPAIAAPLVALGRAGMVASLASASSSDSAAHASAAILFVRLLFVVYAAGVVVVLAPTISASIAARRRIAHAIHIDDPAWMSILGSVRATLGLSTHVRLFVDDTTTVPVTWGVLRPVVVLPRHAQAWTIAERRIVLLHELAHVRAGDWTFNLIARLACAVYWFHPGAWWIARGLHDECELACDDRVIASGVRRSNYAELLINAAASLGPTAPSAVLALSERSGLRARLAAVLDARHTVRPLRREWAHAAAGVTIAIVLPMSTVQLAPTRDVLTTLMRDARWESRAYAVLGLAQRPDSIAVARSAAEADPSPRVRAWARYALGEQTERPDVQAILHEQ